MAGEEDEIPADPKYLYGLHRSFNQVSYDEDLECYPEYFDENGWPLFGKFDPYAFVHSIAGVSWHIAP